MKKIKKSVPLNEGYLRLPGIAASPTGAESWTVTTAALFYTVHKDSAIQDNSNLLRRELTYTVYK